MPEVIKRKKAETPVAQSAPVAQTTPAAAPTKKSESKTNRKSMDLILSTIFQHLSTEEKFTPAQIKTLQSKIVTMLPYTSEFRKKKSNKNNSGIKRALSPYFCFLNAVRAKVIEENPSMTFKDINKLLGKMWKELNDEQKKPYNEMASVQRTEYNQKREAYLQEHPEERKTKKAKKTTTEVATEPAVVAEPVVAKASKSSKKNPKHVEAVVIGSEQEIKTKVKKNNTKSKNVASEVQ